MFPITLQKTLVLKNENNYTQKIVMKKLQDGLIEIGASISEREDNEMIFKLNLFKVYLKVYYFYGTSGIIKIDKIENQIFIKYKLNFIKLLTVISAVELFLTYVLFFRTSEVNQNMSIFILIFVGLTMSTAIYIRGNYSFVKFIKTVLKS